MSASEEPVKPTLLAFHGSGSNAGIHTVQLARLNRLLREHFNVESLEAPFPSPPGPGVLPFFEGFGPYARWLPPGEKVTLDMMKAGTSTPSMPKEVERLVRDTVSRITTSGGRVVGLIGFSQGTKVVAGLLQGAQIRRELGSRGEDWLGKLQFGLCVCSSYAPPLLPPCVQHLPEFQRKEAAEQQELLRTKIALPMLHVLGEQDEWKWAGDGLIESFCEVGEGKCEVVAWDMGHHYPTKPEESEKMKSWLVEQLETIGGQRAVV